MKNILKPDYVPTSTQTYIHTISELFHSACVMYLHQSLAAICIREDKSDLELELVRLNHGD